MELQKIADNFINGSVTFIDKSVSVSDLEWNSHPVFKGVYLKHLIRGNETDDKLSLHIVKIDPGCKIGDHFHAGKAEIHSVIEGNGKCRIENLDIIYQQGSFALIPADKNHSVIADKEGLLILAKFLPALL
jgi:quercetin dioxygenase-like cupin family protein